MTLLELIQNGGFAMYPLLLFSVIAWTVIIERCWNYWRLNQDLKTFHLEAMNSLLRGDFAKLQILCQRFPRLPTSRLLLTAFERLNAQDPRIRTRWQVTLERERQLLNQELRGQLWMLGTIGSAAPFIGLFGTVVGILRSFHEMAKTGSGGFAVVASGISESLIATAAGIVVAVIAIIAYNAFQTRWNALVLTVKLHIEELAEMLEPQDHSHGT